LQRRREQGGQQGDDGDDDPVTRSAQKTAARCRMNRDSLRSSSACESDRTRRVRNSSSNPRHTHINAVVQYLSDHVPRPPCDGSAAASSFERRRC
jgi:hypothetical protein